LIFPGRGHFLQQPFEEFAHALLLRIALGDACR